jgi:hypothetical protein
MVKQAPVSEANERLGLAARKLPEPFSHARHWNDDFQISHLSP